LNWYDKGQDYQAFDYQEIADALKALKLNIQASNFKHKNQTYSNNICRLFDSSE